MKLFLDAKALVNVQNAQGSSPLILAAEAGHSSVARMLLARGANPSAARVDGETPLALARKGGHGDIEELLLQSGATE